MFWWLLFQSNSYSGMELTLLDPNCKAKMNGTHFILESPLNGCGTRHRRSAPDGVVYFNSVSVLQSKAWPWARALQGVTVKLVLTFLWKWGGAYTPGQNQAKCQFSTEWDVLRRWTFLCHLPYWWICGSWEALFSWLEHLWSSLPCPGEKGFAGKVIMTCLSG